jgi:putative peptidoglycan lipid II flippase
MTESAEKPETRDDGKRGEGLGAQGPSGSSKAPDADASATKEAEAERARLVGRAGIVGAGTFLSRLLGLGRDMAFAALFRREYTDAFFVAFTIPNALRQLLAEGAVSSAVVPVLTGKLTKEGEAAARSFFARVRGLSLLSLVLVTVLGIAFARPLVWLFAGGYRDEPEMFERVVTMTRIVFPYIFFMGSAALGMAALNAKRRFGVAAFAPGLLNVAFLAAAFLLPSRLEAAGIDPAHAMAIGAVVGGFLQVVAQWPALYRIGFFAKPKLDLRDPAVREVLRRMLPMTFGIGVYYIDLILSRRFLSELGPGAQSYFSWAMRICDFPQGIFVMALSTAALPALSSLAATGNLKELGKTFAQGMRLALFVAIPASAALVALSHPLVVALFQRGEFGAAAAWETARALVWQGGAVWTVAAVRQLVPVFHAMGDTRTPVVISAIDLVVFVTLAVALKGPMGHVGISAAVAVSSAAQMVLLFFALRRRLHDLPLGELSVSVTRTLVASLVAAAGGWGATRIVDVGDGGGWLVRLLPALIGGVAFVVLFLVAGWGMRSPELDALWRGLSRRLARGRRRG